MSDVSVKDIFDDTIANNLPSVMGVWVSMRAFIAELLHPYDLEVLKERFAPTLLDQDGHVLRDEKGTPLKDYTKTNTNDLYSALLRAVRAADYCEKDTTGKGIDGVRFRVHKSPRPAPTSLALAQDENRQLHKMRTAWKDAAYLLIEHAGALDAARMTAEDSTRLTFRMSMLAAYLYDIAAEYEQYVPKGIRRNLTPSSEELHQMILDPEKHIKVTELKNLHGTFPWRERHGDKREGISS